MDMQPRTIQLPEELISEDTDPAAFAREVSLLAIEFLAALHKFHVFPLEGELEDRESQHA